MMSTALHSPLWNVAAFGWTCVGRQEHGNTKVDTWTAGHDTLVLVWENEATVVAAILNGETLNQEELDQKFAALEPADDLEALLDRARAAVSVPGRVGTELEKLFDSAWRTLNAQSTALGRGPAPFTLAMRTVLYNLALAVLSTPGEPR
jgi:hypothetical protein